MFREPSKLPLGIISAIWKWIKLFFFFFLLGEMCSRNVCVTPASKLTLVIVCVTQITVYTQCKTASFVPLFLSPQSLFVTLSCHLYVNAPCHGHDGSSCMRRHEDQAEALWKKHRKKTVLQKKRKSLAFLFPDKHEFPCDHFSSLTSPKLAAVALHY